MTLMELAERLEAAKGPDRELDLRVEIFSNPEYADLPDDNDHFRWLTKYGGHPKYTASLDAAMTLVPEGWRWIMREARPDKANANERGFFARLETRDFESVTWGKGSDWITDVVAGQDVHCWAATPALALCAASLRARAQ